MSITICSDCGQENDLADKTCSLCNSKLSGLESTIQRPNSSLSSIVLVTPLTAAIKLKEWWQNVINSYGQWECYAIFLTLPADNAVLDYLKNFGNELNLLSGKNCLVITLTKIGFICYGMEDDIFPYAINDHVYNGHSIEVAKLFGISFDQFPSLIIFNDINSKKFLSISCKDLSLMEITQAMRHVFAEIDQAIELKENTLTYLLNKRKNENFKQKGNLVVSKINTLGSMTIKAVLENWIKLIMGGT